MFDNKLTPDEKHQKWFDKYKRYGDSKYFVVLWASLESLNDIPHIDRMIDEGYRLIHVYNVSLEGQRLVFSKPTKVIKRDVNV